MEKYLKYFMDVLGGKYTSSKLTALAKYCKDMEEEMLYTEGSGTLDVKMSNDGVCEMVCWSFIMYDKCTSFVPMLRSVNRITLSNINNGEKVRMVIEL